MAAKKKQPAPALEDLELSIAELEALEADPKLQRKYKKAPKPPKDGKPRDGLGRFAPKPSCADR